jgi:hypothetical protein
MNKLTKSTLAKLSTFKHKEHADRLDDLNNQAQAARRVDVALGLYCFELKEIHLQSGQFGKWLAENKPHLAEKHSKSGLWQPSGSLETAMWFAKSALEVCGYKIGDYIDLIKKQIPSMQGILDSGQMLLIPDAKLPDEFKELRDQIFSLVDGKSQRQLRSEFKQIEDGKVKRGRVKGQGGATKEQCELAAQRQEEERIAELEEQATETTAWLMNNSDCKHLGMIDQKILRALRDALETSIGFIRRLDESQAGKCDANGKAL